MWTDASAGTTANVMLSAATVYRVAAPGPTGVRAEYGRLARDALTDPEPLEVETVDDLAGLPSPVYPGVRNGRGTTTVMCWDTTSCVDVAGK